MTPPLFIPFAPADQEHLVSVVVPREWGGDRGVASLAGVDAERVTVKVLPTGVLRWEAMAPLDLRGATAAQRALRSLAEALEGLGYAIVWEPSPRVVGWAAVEDVSVVPFRPDDGFPICDGYMVGRDDGKAGLYPTREEAIAAFQRENPGAALPLVRIVDLPPSDPRVRARDDALFAAREARRGAGPAADAKHVGAMARNEAAYTRRAGR